MKKVIIFVFLVTLLASGCIRYSPMQQTWTPKTHKKMSTKTPTAYKRK